MQNSLPVDFLWLLLGGAMLYFGAEWLVGGASQLAVSLRIPQLIVGLTVVAYGTSAPEVVVGIQAALGGHSAVALGNVIGSNIANIGLILGVAVLVRPTRVDSQLRRRELPVLLLSTLLLPALLWDGRVARWEAAVLIAAAVGYTWWTVGAARSRAVVREAKQAAVVTAEAADASGAPAPRSRARQGLLALAGLLVLLAGGHLFVLGATGLARTFGLSERVVGLTIVAVGTSLPELATSTIAALRGHSEIAIGNVVGSNIFNVFLCLGTAGILGNITANPAALALDLGTLVAMTLAAVIFLRTERTIRRWEGMVLLAGYLAFLLVLAAPG